MIRILRIGGLALIYVWAKNQAFKSKSKYLKHNKRNDDEYEPSATPAQSADVEPRTSDSLSLPIHTNRTQFTHSDVLVPWKLKQTAGPTMTATTSVTTTTTDTDDKPVKTFLRYYHVFEENELFALCSRFDNIVIEESYYDQGNWCIIFRKNAEWIIFAWLLNIY